MTKVCSKCGEEKDIVLFIKKGKLFVKNWNNSEAKKKTNQKWAESEHGKKTMQEYQSGPGKEGHRKACLKYSRSEKGKAKGKEYAQTDKCKQKQKEYWQSEHGKAVSKTYYESEAGKAKIKAWNQSDAGKASNLRSAHKRRENAENTVNDLTADQWFEILYTQKNCCAHCNRLFTPALPPTRDHIVPLSKGGGLTFDNVQALCRSCNAKKGTKSNEECLKKKED